jgi:hypothetical protein
MRVTEDEAIKRYEKYLKTAKPGDPQHTFSGWCMANKVEFIGLPDGELPPWWKSLVK